MRHHHDDVQRGPQPTLQERLWDAQTQLHEVARVLDRPGPHGAEYASDLYDILGALKVTTADVAEIIRRTTRMLTDAGDRKLTTRPCSVDDDLWLEASGIYAWHLTETLGKAQTSINDIGGLLTSPPPSMPLRK